MAGSKNKIQGLLRKWRSFTHPESAYRTMDGKLRKSRSSMLQKDLAEGDLQDQERPLSSSSSSSQSDDQSLSSVPATTGEKVYVYVGKERRPFVIGADLLNNTLFRGLVEKSSDPSECGAATTGDHHKNPQEAGLTVACEVVLFEHLLWLLANDDPSIRQMEEDELLDFYKLY
ncbi:hypothetical protein CY35_15G005700 [Sphagnum magellanicum]|nr:hypothetical protein CY35_15G005700 [Sphagnum magellanicum]